MKELSKDEKLKRLNEKLSKKYKQYFHCNSYTETGYLRLLYLESQIRDVENEIYLVENNLI